LAICLLNKLIFIKISFLCYFLLYTHIYKEIIENTETTILSFYIRLFYTLVIMNIHIFTYFSIDIFGYLPLKYCNFEITLKKHSYSLQFLVNFGMKIFILKISLFLIICCKCSCSVITKKQRKDFMRIYILV